MPQETHNFTYDTNAPSLTVTATMKDAAGNILDTIAQTVDIPKQEPWWDYDPCNIRIGAGSNNVPLNSSSIQTYSPDSVYFITSSVFSAPEGITDEEYQNTTDEQIRTVFQNFFDTDDPVHNVVRSSYLNVNTTGLIVVDIEYPMNFLSLGDRDVDGNPIKTDEEWTWFTQGIMRRLKILREFIPNAKIGVWRFGDVNNSGIASSEVNHIRDNLFVANVEYEGQKFYDAIDFISPVLYQYFAPDGTQTEQNAYNRIVNGGRTSQIKNVVNALYDDMGKVKPVVVITSSQYEGGSRENQSALTPNSIEASQLISEGVTNMFVIWYASTLEFQGFESYANSLLEIIAQCGFVVDKRPMMYLNFAASPDIDHWKINDGPVDSSGNSIYRKSNPSATISTDDGIKFVVDEILEKAYQVGYRRFCLRTVMGGRTGNEERGNGVPSASWSIGDPNIGTWSDNTNIRDVPSPFFDFEYPFTSTGNLVSEDSSAVIGDRQQSFINFMKPWIDSKRDIGDPVDVYIYDGYQLAFFDTEQTRPARGNLAMTWQYDDPWVNNTENNQLHFPWPDFSIPSHVEYRDGEVIPWRDEVGISGFVVDGASRAEEPDRPPGYFDYYKDRDLFVMGEAVPMINLGGDAGYIFDENTIEAAPYMGLYSNGAFGDFWGNRRWDDKTPSQNSEIHIVLTWGYDGSSNAWSGRHLTGNSDIYDIQSMKDEIDGMINAGYVVSPGFGYYAGSNPPVEAPAREEIINYIINHPGPSSPPPI